MRRIFGTVSAKYLAAKTAVQVVVLTSLLVILLAGAPFNPYILALIPA